MRLIDADNLQYSNITTNEYGYVETTKTVVLEEDIANARTVQAISIDKVKQAREEIDNLDRHFDNDPYTNNIDSMFNCKEVLEILDKMIEESEE